MGKHQLNISPLFDINADVVLYQGNCKDLLRQVPDEMVKLVVTSPPYNIGKSYEQKLNIKDYLHQQKSVIGECLRILHPKGSICWQVGNYVDNGEIIPLDVKIYPIFEEFGLKLRNRIVWHFGHGLHASRRFSGRYEVVLWFTKQDDYTFNLDKIRVPQKYPSKKHFKGPKQGELSGNPLGKNPSDVWDIPNVKANHVEKTAHPCQFPVELIERLVLAMTDEGDWVLDPYVGVGSTLISALMHSRRAIGAELQRKYVTIAQDRICAAEAGKLRVRPLGRSVYDPNAPGAAVPPAIVDLSPAIKQLRLLEGKGEYDPSLGNNENS